MSVAETKTVLTVERLGGAVLSFDQHRVGAQRVACGEGAIDRVLQQQLADALAAARPRPSTESRRG